MVQPINFEALTTSIADAIDVQLFVQQIACGVPEVANQYRSMALSRNGEAPPIDEQMDAVRRLDEHARKYVASVITEQARHFLLDPVRALVSKLQIDAMEFALRQEVGDRASLDTVFRELRGEINNSVEALPKKWGLTNRRGRPRARGAADVEELKAEIEQTKRTGSSKRSDALPDVAERHNLTASGLDSAVYPRRRR